MLENITRREKLKGTDKQAHPHNFPRNCMLSSYYYYYTSVQQLRLYNIKCKSYNILRQIFTLMQDKHEGRLKGADQERAHNLDYLILKFGIDLLVGLV